MKDKIKKIKPWRFCLIITATLMIIFSTFMLFKIKRLDNLIFNQCEPKSYTAWTKKTKIPLTPKQIKELKQEIAKVKKDAISDSDDVWNGIRWGRIRKALGLDKEIIEKDTKILKQGYEIKEVPDEKRRAESREEVEDYKNCLKNQKSAIRQHPEDYRLFFVGNALIIIIGILTAVALK